MYFDFAKDLYDLKCAKEESGQELDELSIGEASGNAVALTCM